jgi:hypothetical protein
MESDPYLNQSDPEYEATARGAQLSIFINGLVYPLWSFMIGALGPPLSPPIDDPIAPRLGVAAVCIVAATLGWRFAWSRDVQIAVRPTAFVLIGH